MYHKLILVVLSTEKKCVAKFRNRNIHTPKAKNSVDAGVVVG